jgi:hypothetical protein
LRIDHHILATRVRRASAVLLALACAITLDRPAAAQAGPTVDPRKEAKMRLGPFYVTPAVLLKDVGIDTNVFDTPVSPQRDFTATLAPRADVWVPFSNRALLTTSTAVGFVYYATYPKARSIDPDVLIRGDVYGRRTTFYAEDRYFKTRDRSFEVDAALARRTENGATGGVAIRFGTKFTTDVAAYQRVVQYEEDLFFGTNLRQSLNRTEDGVRLTFRHKATPLTTIVVRAETQRARFEYSPVRDADGFRVAPGFEFSPKALISGSAEVGVRRFVGKDPALPDFTGVVAKTSLTYTLLETTRFGFTWDRDAIYSFEIAWPYAILNALGGSVRRQIVGRWDGIVSAQRATYDYQNFALGIEQPARRDVTISYAVDVGYRLNRQARVGVVVTTWNRESNAFARGYKDLRAGMSLMYTLPG